MADTALNITKLGDLTLYNESGASIRLSSLWEKTTAVLVFIRHFG